MLTDQFGGTSVKEVVVLYTWRFFRGNVAGSFDDAIIVITNLLEVTRIFGQEIMDNPSATSGS
jgi:hypothetical protein